VGSVLHSTLLITNHIYSLRNLYEYNQHLVKAYSGGRVVLVDVLQPSKAVDRELESQSSHGYIYIYIYIYSHYAMYMLACVGIVPSRGG
jgi:hypothetical protein